MVMLLTVQPLVTPFQFAAIPKEPTVIKVDHSLSNDKDAILVPHDQRFMRAFHKFMRRFNRTYVHGSDEYFERFQNFLATVRRRPASVLGKLEML